MEKCRYLDELGNCTKYKLIGLRPCKQSNISWCDKPVNVIDASRMCEVSSPYGNEYVYITEAQMNELKENNVIQIDVNDGEYSVFVALRRD